MDNVDIDEEDEDAFVRVDDILPNQIKKVPKVLYIISLF